MHGIFGLVLDILILH